MKAVRNLKKASRFFYLEMSAIKISVVIPTFNRPHLLKLCIDALLQQDIDSRSFEVIVVTDGPDKESSRLLSSYLYQLPVIRILSLPQKSGPAAARNAGWQAAVAPLIAFTDDDTLPHKSWLKACLAAYNGEAYIAFTGKVIVPCPLPPTDYEKNIANLETADFITANCMVTKKALQQVGGFDEVYKMAWREDSDLHFKLLQANIPVMHAGEAAVTHPVRVAKWGVSIKEQKKSLYNAVLYKKFPTLYRQKIMPSPVWNYYITIIIFINAVVLFAFGKTAFALGFLFLWLLMTAGFTYKRLRSTSHEVSHVAEMLVTSAIIPFLSVYWTLYGAWRYRVFFL